MDADLSTDSDNGPSEPTTAPPVSSSKKRIVPISSDDAGKADTTKPTTKEDDPKEAVGQTPETAADTSPAGNVEETEEIPSSQAADQEPEVAPEEGHGRQTPAATPDPDVEATDKKPSPETQKAVEEAAKAAEREQEIEDYIDKRQFFVPINSVARKRSVKVSAGLTVLVLLLAVVLIDLMLDSGVILLVQKIPHTHFFTVPNTLKQ